MAVHNLSAQHRLAVSAGHSFKADPGENGTLTANAIHAVSSSTVLLPTTGNTGDRIEVLASAGSTVTVKQGGTTVGAADNDNHLEVYYNGSDWVKVMGAPIFEVYYSITYHDGQYGTAVDPNWGDVGGVPSIGCRIPSLYGSYFQIVPASDHGPRYQHTKTLAQVQADFPSAGAGVTGFENLIAEGASTQITDQVGVTYSNYDGLFMANHEIWNSAYKASATYYNYGSNGNIGIEDLTTIASANYSMLKLAMPNARIGLWGIPTSANYEGGPTGTIYTAAQWNEYGMWDDKWEIMMPHVYFGDESYPGSGSLINRITDAQSIGLPTYPVMFPLNTPGQTHWWTTDDLVTVANVIKAQGCEGLIYWNADFKENVTDLREVSVGPGISQQDYYDEMLVDIAALDALAVNFDPDNANIGNALTVPA